MSKNGKRNITLGNNIKIISQQGGFNAEALDITAEGKLIVKDEDGKIHEILSGEISLREID